jgi:hypothetical protein
MQFCGEQKNRTRGQMAHVGAIFRGLNNRAAKLLQKAAGQK